MPESDWPSNFDYSDLTEVTTLWAVTVPGQTARRAAELSTLCSPCQGSARPRKFPVPHSLHVGVQVKIYDNEAAQSLKTTDIVTFIGILTSETLNSEAESSPTVPTLHVLCHRLQSTNDDSPTGELASVRDDLIKWIANEALGGDEVAAQWLVLELSAGVYNRATPLLPPSITLSRFPAPTSSETSALPTLHYVLADLLPQYLAVPLSLELLNKDKFCPESKDEDLHSGYLQVPHGTALLMTENNVNEGKLIERGIMNIRAVQQVMDTQTLEYSFPFSKFPFLTDIVTIILCEGRKSAFFQTGIVVPLETKPSLSTNFYKKREQIDSPDSAKLAMYRSFLAAAKRSSGAVQIAEETSQYIREDFVCQRQADRSMTAEDLVHLMKVARLLTASMLEREVTIDIWEETKRLDASRRNRTP